MYTHGCARSGARLRKLGLIAIIVIAGLVTFWHSAAWASAATSQDLALGRPAVASSLDSSSRPASKAVDGSLTARWSSAFSDPQWIYVDLGKTYNINEVVLNWETAYGKAYQIQVSNDATNWTTIYSTRTGTGGTNDLTGLSGTGRYVRMYGTARGTQWGYSLFELSVYGSTSSTTSGAPGPVGISGSWTKLIFDDGFSRTSLDSSLWSPNWYGATGTTITDNVNPTAALNCDDPAQVAEGNGELDINAVARPCKTNNGLTYNYASGLVSTYGKFEFTYGAMEARIWMPGSGSVVGNWPAWWADGTGTWPATGEIDVMEGLGGSPCWHFHYSGGAPGGCSTVPNSTSGWHTYAADWEPGAITYYYDGVQVGQVTTGVTSASMYLILFQQVSASLGGPVTAPAAMRVDYVRVWQH